MLICFLCYRTQYAHADINFYSNIHHALSISRERELKGLVSVNISRVTMVLSFHFPELMMMKPIAEQPPSMREPVPMPGTLFKTGEMTFQHAVCFLIFLFNFSLFF